MGLAERRAVERFKNDDYPAWKTKIDAAAGFDLPVDVAWDELAAGDYGSSLAEWFPKVYFQPVVDALAGITIDDLGKSALRDGLAKVVVRNTEQYSSTSGFSFEDRVLTLDHRPYTNVDYVSERSEGLQKLLESAL